MLKVHVPSFLILLLTLSVIANVAIEGMYFIYPKTALISIVRSSLGLTTLVATLFLLFKFYRHTNFYLFLLITSLAISYAFLRLALNSQLVLMPGLTNVNLINGLGLAMVVLLGTGRSSESNDMALKWLPVWLNCIGLICIVLVIYEQQSLILSFKKPLGESVRYNQDVSTMFSIFSLNAFLSAVRNKTRKGFKFQFVLGMVFTYFALQGGGRGEFLALLVLSTFLFLKSVQFKKSLLFYSTLVISVAAVFLPDSIFSRLEFLVFNIGENARVDYYRQSIIALFTSSKALFGFGFGPFSNPEFPDYLRSVTVHNSLLDMYLTFGLLMGTILLFFFILGVNTWRKTIPYKGLPGYCIAFLFLISLKSGDFSSGIIFFPMMSFITIGVRYILPAFFQNERRTFKKALI